MLHIELPHIKSFEALVRQQEDGISLAQGALRVGGVPDEIREQVRKLLITDKADYYEFALGIPVLRQKIAEVLSFEHKKNISYSQVLISHGSIGALSIAALAYLDAHNEVLIPEPAYPVYHNVVRCAKGIPVGIPAYKQILDSSTNTLTWRLDIELIQEHITPKTKMIVLSNPSNPLGMCLSEQELMSLVRLADKHQIYLVVDEVYDLFIHEGSYNSIMKLLDESRFIIRLGSFSKNFAMSGWRVGYLIAHEATVAALTGVQDALLCCPTVVSQYAALYALDHPECMTESLEKVKTSRLLALTKLEQLRQAGLVEYVIPQAGFYLFMKNKLSHELHNDTLSLVSQILHKKHVALVPGSHFGASGAQSMRLCFAREPELVSEALERIISYYKHELSVL